MDVDLLWPVDGAVTGLMLNKYLIDNLLACMCYSVSMVFQEM